MRRWIPWSMGAVGLLALGFALTQVPPAAPYDFLRGYEQLDKLEPEKRTSIYFQGDHGAKLYCFKADYKDVLDLADAELKAKGLRVFARDENYAVYVTPQYRSEPQGRHVTITKDERSSRLGRLYSTKGTFIVPLYQADMPGWVTVIVEGADDPSWFDSLRAWIGL